VTACELPLKVSIYRYNPDTDREPYMQTYDVPSKARGWMVLDVLEYLKAEDSTLTYRRSCREGVCGSDGMNINGSNSVACIKPVAEAIKDREVLILRPLTGMPVIRDLVVDMSLFFKQYERVKPWLINDDSTPPIERLQSPEDRAKLDGFYECILCACCTSGCPSWWWNPDKFIGPAGLLNAYRFIQDSRDTATAQRLNDLNDAYALYRCRNIQNCTYVCPKGLNPMLAIDHIRQKIALKQ
jgi:succinate dehydrogenase / fumarate reductase iron-sulfur subunit